MAAAAAKAATALSSPVSGASSNSSPGAIVGGTGGAGGASGGGTADGGNGGSGGIGVHFTSSAAGATFTNSGTVVGGTGGWPPAPVAWCSAVRAASASWARASPSSTAAPSRVAPTAPARWACPGQRHHLHRRHQRAGAAARPRSSPASCRPDRPTPCGWAARPPASFNVSNIGSVQYRDFGQFEKTGTSTWTLTGSTSTTTNWRVSAGTLEISSEGNLGGAGSAVVLGGGTLRTTGDFTVSRLMLLDSGTNTVNTAGGTELTWSGLIDGPGSLRKAGNGILILEGAKTYGGGTTVAAGTLQLGTRRRQRRVDHRRGHGGLRRIAGRRQRRPDRRHDNQHRLHEHPRQLDGRHRDHRQQRLPVHRRKRVGRQCHDQQCGLSHLFRIGQCRQRQHRHPGRRLPALLRRQQHCGERHHHRPERQPGPARQWIGRPGAVHHRGRRPVRHVGRRGQHGGLDRGRRRLLPGRQPAHGRQQQPVGRMSAAPSTTAAASAAPARRWSKVGTGTLTLSGANTYTGGTTINGGTLVDRRPTTISATRPGRLPSTAARCRSRRPA